MAAATTSPARNQSIAFWAIRFVFMMEAVTIGAWLPRIPDIKTALQLDPGTLGIALIGLPAGTLFGFSVAAQFATHVGLRTACMVAGSGFALAFILPGFAWSAPALFAALAVGGFVVALIEVAMNTKAGRMEQEFGRRIMSQCHGFWSIGTVIGALLGGWFAQLEIAPSWQFVLLNPVFAVIAFAAAAAMPRSIEQSKREPGASFFTLPGKALIALCLMPVGIMALEGGFADWSAIFVREVLAGEPFEAAAAFGIFATFMAVTRLFGDRLAERFGAVATVLVSSLAAAVGAGLFAFAPGLISAYLGAALAGFGVATVYPLAVSAAASAPGKSPEANVAAVSFIAFSVFLAVPPVVGGLAQFFGLRLALAIFVPLALLSAVLSRSVRIGRHPQ